MPRVECAGQLALDFTERISEVERRATLIADWKEWLRKVKRVEDPELYALFDQMIDSLGLTQAFERSKVFSLVVRDGFTVKEIIDLIGVLSADDYHTCWDRKWAYRKGTPKEDLPHVIEWSYKLGIPILDGN